jgi:predicted protein tyrosine phosphatase
MGWYLRCLSVIAAMQFLVGIRRKKMFDSFVSRNAAGVCNNPFQGEAKRVLTVCSASALRSPTAAVVLNQEYGYNTKAAGVSLEYAIVPITGRLLMWADEILCMESWQAQEIEGMLEIMGVDRPVVCMNIDDNYSYMQPELVDLIKQRYEAATVSKAS